MEKIKINFINMKSSSSHNQIRIIKSNKSNKNYVTRSRNFIYALEESLVGHPLSKEAAASLLLYCRDISLASKAAAFSL